MAQQLDVHGEKVWTLLFVDETGVVLRKCTDDEVAAWPELTERA